MYSTELTSAFPTTWKWQRLHSVKLQILPITCKLDVKLKMMWWTPIKQLYSPRYFSDWVDKNYFSQSSKRLGHASLFTPLSWCLKKQEKIKRRFGMFQHLHLQKRPLKDNRNLNVEITNNYWIRLSIEISSVCIHSKQLNLVPRSSRLTVQFTDNFDGEANWSGVVITFIVCRWVMWWVCGFFQRRLKWRAMFFTFDNDIFSL